MKTFLITATAVTLGWASLAAAAPRGYLYSPSGSARTMGNGPDLANKSFTIEFWSVSYAASSSNWLLSQGTESANNGLSIGFNASDDFVIDFYGNPLSTSAAIPGEAISPSIPWASCIGPCSGPRSGGRPP